MTAPLAQIAREIAAHCMREYNWLTLSCEKVKDAATTVMERHWPAARGVVEVQDHDFGAACGAAGIEVRGGINYRAGADCLNSILRARDESVVENASTDGIGFPMKSYRLVKNAVSAFEKAVDSGEDGEELDDAREAIFDATRQCIADGVAQQLGLRARAVSAPVVVTRPVRTVTKLRTPAEEGVADSRSVNVEWSQIASMGVGLCLRNAGEVTAYINFVLRWCVPGQPWVERTEVQKPASWTEDTLPEIGRPFWFFTENERGSGEIRRNSDTPFDAGWFNAVDAIAWCYVTLPEVSHARP